MPSATTVNRCARHSGGPQVAGGGPLRKPSTSLTASWGGGYVRSQPSPDQKELDHQLSGQKQSCGGRHPSPSMAQMLPNESTTSKPARRRASGLDGAVYQVMLRPLRDPSENSTAT